MKSVTKPYRKDMRGNSFATTIKLADNEEDLGANGNAPRKQGSDEKCNPTVCVSCSCEHSLAECPQLYKKRHWEKINFLMEKGICFACLCTGHRSKNCA